MAISVKLITHVITVSRWSFENARDRLEIQDKIKGHGYDPTRMNSLIEFNDRMHGKLQEQQQILAQQDIACKNFYDKFHDERKQCKYLRLLIRKTLQPDDYEKYKLLLALDEKLKMKLEGFFEQARKLYNNCGDDAFLLNKLSKFSVTGETFRERLQNLDELLNLYKVHETARALSQVATRDRDILFGKFRKEWTDFRDVCKLLYEGDANPEFQELLGIKSYSPGYKKNPGNTTATKEESKQ
ncbi:MAG: hypothetical protein QG657_5010 [Acidobacteriota bacterium]|nr:hypothetical protein [Acidobacteriota bacterium]